MIPPKNIKKESQNSSTNLSNLEITLNVSYHFEVKDMISIDQSYYSLGLNQSFFSVLNKCPRYLREKVSSIQQCTEGNATDSTKINRPGHNIRMY